VCRTFEMTHVYHKTYWNYVCILSLVATDQMRSLSLTNWTPHRGGTRRSGGRYPLIPNLSSIGDEVSGICCSRFVTTESAPRKWWPPEPIRTFGMWEKSLALQGIEPRFLGHFRHNLVSELEKLYMKFSKHEITLQLCNKNPKKYTHYYINVLI
jgi:hypothetical protein